MAEFNIAVFGCWNEGCKENSGQKSVSKLIKANEYRYKFMVILGDNYYGEKKLYLTNLSLKLEKLISKNWLMGLSV